MAKFNCSKLNFIKFFLVFIVLLTSSINIAQTKEKIDIEGKAKELGITTTELQGILNSALRNGGSDNPQQDSLANIILTGEAAGDNFGTSVSIAGDVNGDGYSDVIVGAEYDFGGSNAGRSYIYFGGTSMDNIADVIMTGEAADDWFGWSVSTAGDVNGDGYSDVMVGASRNDAGGNSAGRAYIYFGGTSMDTTADVIMTGEAAGDYFGVSVSTAGDVNGDGYSDVIVGAYLNDAGGGNAGRSYIYFGGTSMDNTPDVTMNGEAAFDYFGNSVSTAGDVNGDGYSDVIVGANYNDAGGYNAGRSYIYFGGISMDNIADVIVTGEAADDYFGNSVSTAGDVNGDGYSDVIVGADGNDAGGTSAGRSYIYFGGTSMDNTPDVIMTGEAAVDHFGNSVSTSGDVNGDGYSDVIVGADENDAGGNYAGRSYIYFGGTSMDNIADVIMTGEAAVDYFGWSVSTAGDVNGDGYSDVIVGAPYNDAGGSAAGRAYIYLSSIPPTSPWSNQIVVEDAGGTESSEVLTFGQHPDATDSIDSSLGEYELPPPPFPGIFDARFNLPTNPIMSSLIDFRDSSLAEITWVTTFQPGSAGYPFTFTWDSTSFPGGTFYLKDLINGSYVFVDMKNQSSYILTEPAITSLNIIFYKDSTIPIAPLPPTNLLGIADTSSVELSWLDNSDNETGFIIERKDGDSLSINPFVIIDTVASNQTVYTNSGLSPDTTYTYRIIAFNEFGPSVYSNLVQITTLTLPVTFHLTVSVLDGWNMVSAPGLHPTNQDVTTWWPNLTGSVFKFSGGYVATITAATGEGYWMKNAGTETYDYPAIQIVPHDTISAAAGWNMIGGYEDRALTSGLITTPPGLISGSVFGYSGAYNPVDTLVPGYGYWIKLSAVGGIIIPPPGPLSKGNTKAIEYFKEDWGKITITDNAERSYTLYAVNGEVDLNNYELPPVPPGGMFDIRFGSGRIAENISNSIQSIEMSGIEHPVRVSVENMSITVQDESGNNVNAHLTPGEEIIINNSSISKLLIISGEIGAPIEYALEQNYPNPFNPSTTIKFAVPKESNVNLSIYNMLGELISTLVDEQKKPGHYEYKFKASNLASGVYLYRIKAGDFVETKKMVLLR